MSDELFSGQVAEYVEVYSDFAYDNVSHAESHATDEQTSSYAPASPLYNQIFNDLSADFNEVPAQFDGFNEIKTNLHHELPTSYVKSESNQIYKESNEVYNEVPIIYNQPYINRDVALSSFDDLVSSPFVDKLCTELDMFEEPQLTGSLDQQLVDEEMFDEDLFEFCQNI